MFGVQGAESFQAEYQKLIDTWMRRFTEIEDSINCNQSKPNQEKGQEIEKEPVKLNDIKIWDSDGNILYEKGKTYDITPDFIQKIEEASELSPSDKLEELPSLTVEVDGEIFFKSENGEVSVNKRSTLEQEAGVQDAWGKGEEISLADKSPAEEEALEYREGEPGDISSYSSSFRSREEEISDPTTDILVELMAPIIEAMPVIEPELEQHSERDLNKKEELIEV